MNKISTVEYIRRTFRAELLLQAILLILLLMSPVKLVSIVGSTVYIIMYFLICKVLIIKLNMRQLLIFNILLNIVPPLYIFIVICLNAGPEFTNVSVPVFTAFVILSAFAAYKVVMSKVKLRGVAGMFLIIFFISQFIINNMEIYTAIMIAYIASTFIFVRYPLECFRMYKNNEEYIYY